jgi:serine/threonine protein kinase
MSHCLNPTCQRPENSEEATSCSSCGKNLSPLRDRYYIIRSLGGGGFGRTFLAEDRDKLNELCVVKQLVPQLQGTSAQQKATQLFEQEAKRLQQLGEHPQIPTLYAYFKADEYLYLVQQLIVGQSLREQLDLEGVFSQQQIWELIADLLPVLQFVHSHQVIHRDIKPDNIMRRQSDRRLVLIDFGVSKQFSTSEYATGTSIGSFGYASSEQMNAGVAYPASDLYSLGVTCFYLLTKISPTHLWTEYGYSWVKQWQQHLNVQISPELRAILDRMLQKDIQQRYQTVEQVLQDLRQIPAFLDSHVTQIPSHLPNFSKNLGSKSTQNLSPATTLNPRVSFGWRYQLLLVQRG